MAEDHGQLPFSPALPPYRHLVRASRAHRLRVTAVAEVVGAVAALVLFIAREGPDQVRVGTVTSVSSHRLCVAADDGEFCAHVDSPGAVADIERDDCIELARSADETFESARASDAC